MRLGIHLLGYPDPTDPSVFRWSLRVEENHESYGLDWHCSGRVELQDESVAVAKAVLDQAIEKTESALVVGATDPLF